MVMPNLGVERHILAHELGHHLFGDAYSADWGADTSEAERSLDAFAGHLLLPRAGVCERWQVLRQQYHLRQSAIILSAANHTNRSIGSRDTCVQISSTFRRASRNNAPWTG